MKATSADQYAAWRLARMTLVLIVTACASFLAGVAAILTATIGARLSLYDLGQKRLTLLDSSGWFPGWPYWTVTLFLIGNTLLLLAAISFFMMHRVSLRTKSLLVRLKQTSRTEQ